MKVSNDTVFIIYVKKNIGGREGFVPSLEEEIRCKSEYFDFRKNLFGAWWNLSPTTGIETWFDLDRQDKESGGNNYKFSCYNQLRRKVR